MGYVKIKEEVVNNSNQPQNGKSQIKDIHSSELVSNFKYQLFQRRKLLWNRIDEIEDYWEDFGGAQNDEDDLKLRVYNDELIKVKELIRLIRKH